MKKIILGVLLCLFFACSQEKQSVSKIVGKRINISDTILANKEIEEFITPYRNRIDESMSEVLSYASKNMHKGEGEFETSIGNMMADMVLSRADVVFHKRTGKHIDFCMINHGGMRAPIPQGDVTMRTAFKVMPFENEIVVAELTSENVKALVAYLVKEKRAHPISGLRLELSDDYSLKKATINGKSIEDGRTYFVVTSDYLQQGGDRMHFFKDPVSLEVINYKIRAALIDYFKSVDTIPVVLDGRFVKH